MTRGAPPAKRQELVRAEDRLTFVYLEQCVVHREDNAITAKAERGTVHIPAAMIGALLLGPGTRITHPAMAVIGAHSATVAWVGEGALRCYAVGRPIAASSRLLEAQARAFANQSKRLDIARRMYALRFPGEDVSELTMQQLRGREGARVRNLYAQHARRTGMEWSGRFYKPGELDESDPLNQALTSANVCLYGVVTAVIHALGMTPGLGFVHVGKDQSFVYDVADLFKADTTIPAAFDVVAKGSTDPANDVRRYLRDRLVKEGIMEACVKILRELFLNSEEIALEKDMVYDDSMSIWSGRGEARLNAGQNFSGSEP